MLAQLLLGCIVVAAALLAVYTESLVASAVALAVGNIALALLLMLIGASLAGILQLSVGVGVLSALFLVAISLTERMGKSIEEGDA
jgi:NADH:ubiquinone oxidoreductase subunit 6 (subunit J)